MSAIDDSALLSRYLLHDVSEKERDEIEQRYFRDPDALALLDAVEGDLIDAYVRRELSRAQRARFEKYFLCTRARRDRLRMAQALQQHLPSRRAISRMWIAIAASLLIVTALGVWFWLRTAPPAVVHRPAPPPRIIAPEAPVTVAVTLVPGLTRAAGAPQKIVLGPDVEQVRVSALVEAEGEWRDLRASLGDWAAANLTMNADRTVTIIIPAAKLTPGEHVLVLTAGNEPLGDYAFAVEKKNSSTP